MGALAHYLEEENIPTTQISLIYKHTDIIRPPRALWVPFELGRPLGEPNNAQFQRKVLLRALQLLEAEQCPVLESFPEDAPGSKGKDDLSAAWACPVSFSASTGQKGDNQELADALQREVADLRPWYDLGLENRERTAMVKFDPESAPRVILDFLFNRDSSNVPEDLTPGNALRLAAQDLKAFYFESVISRPGADIPDSETFGNWFWNDTHAGEVLKQVQENCSDSDDEELRTTARMFLKPMPQ